MGELSSQVVIGWVLEGVNSENWTPVQDLCISVIRDRCPTWTETKVHEAAHFHYEYVVEGLRTHEADALRDGELCAFEIDPRDAYVRGARQDLKSILQAMRTMDPFAFEDLCALVLERLGAIARGTPRSHDGGVDFIASNMHPLRGDVPIPRSAFVWVIGQAKRYKAGNRVKERELREFVGGALDKLQELRKDEDLNSFSPCLLAFWTTSEFDENAKNYARRLGLWTMNGLTMAELVRKLEISIASATQ